MNRSKSWPFILCLLVLGFLTGCSGTGTTSIQSPSPASPEATVVVVPSETAVPPSLTPTETLVPPTFTATPSPSPLPTDTVEPSATPTNTPLPPTPSGENAIYIYLVQLGTGGSTGCGDSLVKVNTGRPRSGDVAADIATALRSLLVKSPTIAGLYNPVYLSNMSVTGVDYKISSKSVTVNLSGTYVRSGDRCDDGRVRDQIWTTIRQFPEAKGSPLVLLDGNLLGDILSTAPGRESPKHKP